MNITKVKFGSKEVEAICKDVVKYNIVTVAQLAHLAGCSIATVEGKIRPYETKKKSYKLTTAYPFSTPFTLGPKFVLWNEECERFILDSVR